MEWLESLDTSRQNAVNRRIDMLVEHDHFGDCRSLRAGLLELRLVGVGLRVYLSRIGPNAVLLLGGSDKGKQNRAIGLARNRLKEFKERST